MSTKVQMLARWSELSIKNNHADREEAELKRIIHGEEDIHQHMMIPEIKHEYGPIVFDMKDVKRYNKAKEFGHTTVHFKDGDSLVLKIPFLEFMEVDLELIGKQITDYTPNDFEDDETQRDDETNRDLEL